MKRWRIGKKRTTLSKSMNNMSQSMVSILDISTSPIRNATSISDMACVGLFEEDQVEEDVSPDRQSGSFASTDWNATGDGDSISSNVSNKMVEQQNNHLKEEAAPASDNEEHILGHYEPVYTRSFGYKSNTVMQAGSVPDQWLPHYDAHNPRPSSLSLEQEFTAIKVSETLTVKADLNGNLLATLEPPKRRVSVDVLRSQFAASNSKDHSLGGSKEKASKVPSVTINSVSEEVEQDGDTVEQSGSSGGSRQVSQDISESTLLPTTSINATKHESTMEASSSLEDEDLAGVKECNESSTDGDTQGRVQASGSTALAIKTDQQSTVLNNKATKRMLRLFARLPLSEKAIDYYSCALFSDILLHGTLYITTNYIAFYSKIFYHVNRVLLPSSQIKRVAKVNTAKIIPNGIGIYLHDGRRFLFGSLLSRDATYNLLVKVATESGGLFICDNEAQEPQNNGEEEMASASSEQSQTDQDGQSAHSSGSNSSTPSTEHKPLRPPLPRQSSSTSLGRVDEVAVTPIAAAQQQEDKVDGRAHAVERKSSSINHHATEQNDSSCEDDLSSPTSYASPLSKNSNKNIQDWANQNKERSSPNRQQKQEKKSLIKEILRKTVSVLWAPRSTILNVLFCSVLVLLFTSSLMLMYRLQRLSDELSAMPVRPAAEQDNLLELQQRLHSTAASELEQALGVQLQHLSMVRRSLNDLVQLFQPDEFEGGGYTVRTVAPGDPAA